MDEIGRQTQTGEAPPPEVSWNLAPKFLCNLANWLTERPKALKNTRINGTQKRGWWWRRRRDEWIIEERVDRLLEKAADAFLCPAKVQHWFEWTVQSDAWLTVNGLSVDSAARYLCLCVCVSSNVCLWISFIVNSISPQVTVIIETQPEDSQYSRSASASVCLCYFRSFLWCDCSWTHASVLSASVEVY